MLLIIAIVFFATFAYAIQNPARSIRGWIILTCFVPSWTGVTVPQLGYMAPAVLVLVPILPAIALSTRVRIGRITWWDVGMLALVGIGFTAVQLGTPQSEGKAVLLLYALPYVVGRYCSDSIGAVGLLIARLTPLFGGLGVVEIATRFHPFAHLDTGSPLGFWAAILTRGSLDRSEVSFGHPLALGGFIALGLPFVIRYLSGRQRIVAVAVSLAGIASTVSRGPALAAIAVLVLCLVPGRGLSLARGRKQMLFVWTGTLALVALPFVTSVANEAQSNLQQTATGRLSLLQLVSHVVPLGLGNGAELVGPTLTFGGYQSIDNSFLYAGLLYGWVFDLIILAGVVALVWRYVRGRTGPATIALLSAIPLLLTVGWITQYGTLLWFVVGLAVSERRPESLSAGGSAATARAYDGERRPGSGQAQVKRMRQSLETPPRVAS